MKVNKRQTISLETHFQKIFYNCQSGKLWIVNDKVTLIFNGVPKWESIKSY